MAFNASIPRVDKARLVLRPRTNFNERGSGKNIENKITIKALNSPGKQPKKKKILSSRRKLL